MWRGRQQRDTWLSISRVVIPVTYALLAAFAHVAVRVYFPRMRVSGLDNVPGRGGVIVAANHLDFADPCLLIGLLPRRAVFLTTRAMYGWPLVGLLPRLLGALPVDTSGPDVELLRDAERELHRGLALVIFPEGERSRRHALQKGLPGAALLACRTGVPIVPVAITGTERVSWPWVLLRPLLGPPVSVRVGAPFHLPATDRADARAAKEGIEIVMRRIAELLPPAYRGEYPADATSLAGPP
jgi:1-acyl-sn-glycerol-3-phosphate acyltransferase